MKNIIYLMCSTILLVSCSTIKISETTETPKTNEGVYSSPVKATINLVSVTIDKVPVIINPGEFNTDIAIYRLPKVVQGTYAVSDFGKYIDAFKALDYNGNELSVTKTDNNSWEIKNAIKLDKITYLVNDTFDTENEVKENKIFSPSGTNIGNDNFVLNLFGFIGYFDSLKNAQYSLDIISPTSSDFKRTSALKSTGSKVNSDNSTTTSYFANRYFDIVDNPMMYGKLDVATFPLDDIKITLSVYSPSGLHTANEIAKTVKTMMQAQKKYLGDINSTSGYHIFIYLADEKPDAPTGFGALEHHTSTTVVLPEDLPKQFLAEQLVDIVSHEFFHIISPLSVHSEDVHYFDYNNPTFSKHLWMYEGVTEYFATLFQVDQGLTEKDDFFDKILSKISRASTMNDSMSFTKMSENILEEPYQSQYENVYKKGALIGMCIDILIREESNGQQGVLSLMKELSLKYGKNKPFKDDKLIDEIVAMTYPSLRVFFDNHVIGNTPINYNDFFKKVGLTILETKVKTNLIQNDGEFILDAEPNKGLFFINLVTQNSFWNEQGVKPNDIVKSLNGEKVTFQNAEELFTPLLRPKLGDTINVVLLRNSEEITINTKITQSYTIGKSIIVDKNASEKEKVLLNTWIKGGSTSLNLQTNGEKGSVKGKVIDNITKMPIPYLNIWIENEDVGTTSNKEGEFNLEMDDKTKTIVFSAIGYETKKMQGDFLNDLVVLNPNSIKLEEVVINAKKETKNKVIGKFKKSGHNIFFGCSGKPIIRAKFFTYDKSFNETPFLSKIKVLTSSGVKKGAKFNIRLYTVGKDGKPNEYLYDKNIIGIAKKGDHKTEIDISNLDIIFPEEGFFVSFEWLIIEENKYETEYKRPGSKKKYKRIGYSPSVGTVPTLTDENNWVFKQGKWMKLKRQESDSYVRRFRNKYSLLAIALTLSN